MTTVLAFLYSIIGTYQYEANCPDWPWIMSALLLIVIVWGVIIIVRSVISRV